MKLLLLALLALPAFSQDAMPNNFFAAGLGFQGSSVPHTSGWATACTKTVSVVYACVRTDYAGGGVTSTRAEAHPLIKTIKGVAIFGTAGAGMATGPTGGIGGAFDFGGALATKLPAKLGGSNGWYAVASGSWQKDNILQAPDLGAALKAFGTQTVWRFGFGRAW